MQALALNGRKRKKLSPRILSKSSRKQPTIREAAELLGCMGAEIRARINSRWPRITVIQKAPGADIRLLASDIKRVYENGWNL